ncbi:MAG: hypothetical protein ACK5O7_01885 [Holosporales bacterium]
MNLNLTVRWPRWSMLCFIGAAEPCLASFKVDLNSINFGDDFAEVKTVTFEGLSTFVLIDDYPEVRPPMKRAEDPQEHPSIPLSSVTPPMLLPDSTIESITIAPPKKTSAKVLTLSVYERETQPLLQEAMAFIEELEDDEDAQFIEQRQGKQKEDTILKQLENQIASGELTVEDLDAVESIHRLGDSSVLSLSESVNDDQTDTLRARVSFFQWDFWGGLSRAVGHPTAFAACAAYIALAPMAQKDLFRLYFQAHNPQTLHTRNAQ